MLMNQVPNLNHYPVNGQDTRFGFLPFVGGLAVGALAGGFGGPRPCGPMCGQMPMPVPMQPQFVPVPVQTLPMQMMPQQPFQTAQSFQTVQGPILESNKFFIR